MSITGDEKFLVRVLKAEKVSLFLDYDGTLAEFAPTPDEIFPDPDLIELLAKLNGNPKFELAIISGRRLSHIQKLVPLSGILLAGTYGLEMRLPDGRQVDRVEYDQIRPLLDEMKPGWLQLTKDFPDLYLEDKGWSLALHAKNIEDARAEDVLRLARNQITGLGNAGSDFRVLGGENFLEIAPNLANKGVAVDFLLAQRPYPGLPVYIGDDDKDEEAFEIILRHQGVAIKVCETDCATRAQLRANNTWDVRQFLKSLN